MKTVGQKIEAFSVAGVKPRFNNHEENGQSAFETITEASFPGKWKIIYFYPKDFTFVCPTEIVEFDKLAKTSKNAMRFCSAALQTTNLSSWRGGVLIRI